MAAEEKLEVPSGDFFAAVKYHAVGSLQDQVSASFLRLFTLFRLEKIVNFSQNCLYFHYLLLSKTKSEFEFEMRDKSEFLT